MVGSAQNQLSAIFCRFQPRVQYLHLLHSIIEVGFDGGTVFNGRQKIDDRMDELESQRRSVTDSQRSDRKREVG